MLAATFMNPGPLLLLELGADSASSVSTLSCSSKFFCVVLCFSVFLSVVAFCVFLRVV